MSSRLSNLTNSCRIWELNYQFPKKYPAILQQRWRTVLYVISMRSCGLVCTDILKRTFSSSVFVSTCSVILITSPRNELRPRVESLDNIPLKSKHRGCDRDKLHTLSVIAEEVIFFCNIPGYLDIVPLH